MVVTWIKRWLAKPTAASELVTVERNHHQVSRSAISTNALKVLHRLNNAGHEAYLVGGCVRDLQLGLAPKDFDIATDATPEEVRKLFSNSRIIGRRFRIVHVTFGREIIEVTTFRGSANEVTDAQTQSSEGMLLRDNVYGTLEEDAKRRDFTINAMYYTPKDFSVMAYPLGLSDLHNRLIRIIGEPETRYREDPVRMLRAVRFAAKLDFEISEETAQPFAELSPLLTRIAPARLFDEVIKLFMSGYGLATWQRLMQNSLIEPLLPITHHEILHDQHGQYNRFIELCLRNTDKRIQANKPVTPAFLYAALLWPAVRESALSNIEMGTPEMPAWHKAMATVLDRQVKTIAIPKRFSIPMKEIWELQIRMRNLRPQRVETTFAHPRFRAAYDFLLVREESGEALDNLGQWWTTYQQGNPDTPVERSSRPAPSKRRRRRPRAHSNRS